LGKKKGEVGEALEEQMTGKETGVEGEKRRSKEKKK